MHDFKDLISETYDLVPQNIRPSLVLIGSVNLLLQGVNVVPKKDIDLATDFGTVVFLIKYFDKRLVRSCDNLTGDDYLPFSYAFIEVDRCEVEFFDAINHTESYYYGSVRDENTVKLIINDRLEIRGLTVKEELSVVEKAGKLDKAEAIKRYLKTQKKAL